MRKILPVAILAVSAVALLFLLGASRVQAQATSPDKNEVDSLVERIKAAKAEMERMAAEEERGENPDATKPEQGKPKEKPKDKEAKKADTVRRGEVGAAETPMDRYRYLRDTTTLRLTGPRDVLKSYDVGASREELLKRIREGRAAEAQTPKSTEAKKSEEGGIARVPGVRDYHEMSKEYSPDRVYLAQPRAISGVVGADMLPGRKDLPSIGTSEMTRSGSSELPDPNKSPDRYAQFLKDQYGQRGVLPQFADPSLRSTYEAQRFQGWLYNEQGVRVEPGRSDISQLYNTYKNFQQLPPVNNSLGRRDAYVPNSTNYLNSAYRGSIYGTPFTDPYVRSYSTNTTQSKYGSTDYYSLNTRESWSDYYQREFGVNNSFVPGSASRQFDVNTLKQWSDGLRQNYNIDVRPGDRTYSDMYRLNTSRPRY